MCRAALSGKLLRAGRRELVGKSLLLGQEGWPERHVVLLLKNGSLLHDVLLVDFWLCLWILPFLSLSSLHLFLLSRSLSLAGFFLVQVIDFHSAAIAFPK